MIEHLPKSVGADLIEYLQYRFHHVFLVIPVDWVVYEFADFDHESHVSIWTLNDMNRFEGAYAVQLETEEGKRFLLCSVNGIVLATKEHFVVRDISNHEKSDFLLDVEFGYLNE
ncbi:hypothetical protein ACFL1J_00985 [Pseudomonadota bacterium]